MLSGRQGETSHDTVTIEGGFRLLIIKGGFNIRNALNVALNRKSPAPTQFTQLLSA